MLLSIFVQLLLTEYGLMLPICLSVFILFLGLNWNICHGWKTFNVNMETESLSIGVGSSSSPVH